MPTTSFRSTIFILIMTMFVSFIVHAATDPYPLNPVQGNTVTYDHHLELPEGRVGQAYQYKLWWPEANYTFQILAGQSLPPGLSFNSATGTVSGTPGAAGAYRVAMSANNGEVFFIHILVQATTPPTRNDQSYTRKGAHPVRQELVTIPFATPPTFSGDTETLATLAYPAAAPGSTAAANGRFPLICLSHGNSYFGHNYTEYLEIIASHGFIVIAPNYRLSTMGIPHISWERAWYQRRAYEWVLEKDREAGAALQGHVDRDNIGLAGHSWGGVFTSINLFSSPARAFLMIDTISMMNNANNWHSYYPLFNNEDGYPAKPIMALKAGLSSPSGFGQMSLEYLGAYRGPRYHVTFNGAQHEDFLNTTWTTDPRVFNNPLNSRNTTRAAAHYTVAFFSRYLKDDARAGALLSGPVARDVPSAVSPLNVGVASFEPSSDMLMIDDFADGELSSNNLGLQTTNGIAGASIGKALLADEINTFSSFAADLLNHTTHRTLRIETGTNGALLEKLGSAANPLDASRFSHLALDVTQLLSDVNADLPLTVHLRDAVGGSVALPARPGAPAGGFQSAYPHTLFLALPPSGLDRSRLVELELRVAPPAGGVKFSVDNIRFEQLDPINRIPRIDLVVNPADGIAPLNVTFDASGSSDPEGSPLNFAWDFGDGNVDSGAVVSHSYASSGNYLAFVTVTDTTGLSLTASKTVTVRSGGSPVYALTDLGTLGGTRITARAINKDRHITGEASNAENRRFAFRWTPSGGIVNLGDFGADLGSKGYDVNDLGQISGGAYNPDYRENAFLWTAAQGMTSLGTLGGSFTYGSGINEKGEVTGTSSMTDFTLMHAFRWTSSGGMQDLGTLGGRRAVGEDINENGTIIGYSERADFTWSALRWTAAGGLVELTPAPAGREFLTGAYLHAINDNGLAVGRVGGLDTTHAYAWSGSDGWTDLGGYVSYALDINNGGRVVGSSSTTEGKQRAVLWIPDTGMLDLNHAVINPPAGLLLKEAAGINENGDIVANGTVNGEQRAFLLRRSNRDPVVVTPAKATPNPVVVNNTVTLSVSGNDPDGDPVSVSWVLGDGRRANGASVDHTYSTTGSFQAVATISDGKGGSASSSVIVQVVPPANQPPTISNVTNKTTHEDTATPAIPFTVGDPETPAGSLIVTATSSNTTLVPIANIVLSGSGANRTVTITPAANRSGSSTITLTVSDGQATASDSFRLTVHAVNDAPTISNITNKTTPEDTSTPAIPFTVGDQETAAGSLTVTAGSSNTTLVPIARIVFGGSGANRTVTLSPASGRSGTSRITITVSDGQASASDAFTLTVGAVNDPPTISNIADQATDEDTPTSAIPFTVNDPETAAGSLLVTATPNNPTLIPPAGIALGGSGANRTITVTPAANQSGSATITVTVSDGQASASDSFTLTVHPVNDHPTISDIADQTTNEDQATPPISFAISDIETAAGSLTVTATSSNPTLVPPANIALGGSGANRTVALTPAADLYGSSTITLTVSDGVATASDTFKLTVRSVNDEPTAIAEASPATGPAPLSVGFDGGQSVDPDGTIVSWAWDFGDGTSGQGATTSHTYNDPGTYDVSLTVTDDSGATAVDTVRIVVTEGGGGGDPLPLELRRALLRVNFATVGSDMVTLIGSLELDRDFTPDGKTLTVSVAGVSWTLTLDSRGLATAGNVKARLRTKRRVKDGQPNIARFSFRATKQKCASTWAGVGMTNETVSNKPVSVAITVRVDGQAFAVVKQLSYTAKEGRRGRAR